MLPNNETYNFSPKLRTIALGLLGGGLLLFVLGVIFNMEYPSRIWTNLFITNYYFLAISFAAMFFVASQTIGYNGWFILVKRIFEAMGSYVKVGAGIMLLILIFGAEHIYHWMDHGIMDPNSDHYDALVAGKEAFLNKTFFFGATVVYLVLWVVFTFFIRKNSVAMDNGWDLKLYDRSRVICMAFLVVFGVSTSTAIWHWIMSIDPHWFSTLFGWYCFISMFVGSLSTATLIAIYLKKKGHLTYINENHFHDLGKWMFAFSVAWAYLWFSQFMLIWYGNIPEETLYFLQRWENYPMVYYSVFIINFILPFFVLMTAGNKRRTGVLTFVAPLLVFGHWLDFYLMATPGSTINSGYIDASGYSIQNFGLGLIELGLPIAYTGLFILVVFSALSKSSLVPRNHPFIKESMVHHA